MLKWLVAREGEGLPTITDDPLATIPRAKKDRKNEIYSVNRFNPLFDDAMVTKLNICDSLSDGAQTASSTSSGYASQPSTTPDPVKAEAGCDESEESRVSGEPASPGGESPEAGVPGPVWPDTRAGTHGSLPLKAGNVARKIQKLNIQLNQQESARIVRKPDYVTSISVESDDREEEVVTGGVALSEGSDHVLYQNVPFHMEGHSAREGADSQSRNKIKIRSNPELVPAPQPLPGLTGRAWPGTSLNYSERANLTQVPAMLRTPDRGSDRCFGIRHKAMSPIGEELEKDTRMNDSIVTSSLLMMTSLSGSTSGTDKRKDGSGGAVETDQEEGTSTGPRLDYMTKAVIRSQHASTLSRAMNQAKRSFRGSRRSLRSTTSKRRNLGTRRERSRASAGKAGGGAEAMRELWERTGMKTNGRKLLIESEDEEEGKVNDGYQSDGSEVSVPRVKGIRKLPAGHRKTGSQSSTTSYDSLAPRASRPVLVRSTSTESTNSAGWEVRGGQRLNGLRVVDLDTVQVDGDSDGSTKHVRFSARTRYSQFKNDEPAKGGRQAQAGVWDRYYGTTDPRQLEAGLAAARTSRNCGQRKAATNIGSDMVMERLTSGILRRKERKRRGLRCFCKTFCFLLLLTSFLLVIVAVSIFLSRGRNYFGSLEV